MTISVYIPTRNRVDLLAAAVASVLAQEFTDIDLIVVDDASTDGTAAYLESVVRSDRRVRFIRNDSPCGAPISRNKAIRQAVGEFVTGLDDDDQFTPRRLGELHDFWIALARCGTAASCIYAQDILISGGQEIGTTKKQGSVDFSDLIKSNQIGNQIFAPKQTFEAAGLFDERLPAWQDLELFMRIVKKFGPARLLDIPLYRFDVTPSRSRISSKQEKVRTAYKLVSDLHCSDDVRSRQRLMLQQFSPYYGIRPTAADFAEFARLGFYPRGLAALAARLLRI
ncbi:glycosyltransferase [Bradyrhizobium jicamae]|uniref:Glycosyltransferase n=1 Tax=Bradyrhizobium jicamae TaxID=280332 RepID=A0ABS5FK47_9BRAD|nr:glycosyltransferase [Bradyrhizobium jicamae]MBR0797153.1 glycosyltransferase [Bradyrhizobium jicamae]MBR0934934.1 glycosyltransferase [Bradyrhizobium jicamae]